MRNHSKILYSAIGLLVVSSFGSSAYSADCEWLGQHVGEQENHTYHLSVTSYSGGPVRITGSIAVSGPDQFVQIDTKTPYEITVVGQHYLLIVGSANVDESIDFSLSKDGQVATYGSDNPLYAVGDGIPSPHGLFSANYPMRDKTE